MAAALMADGGWQMAEATTPVGRRGRHQAAISAAAVFVAQRFDRIELRRLRGGIDAEDDADQGAEGEGAGDGDDGCVNGRQCRPSADDETCDVGEKKPARDADETAESGERDRLDEELHEHVAAARAERLADADLARALGD